MSLICPFHLFSKIQNSYMAIAKHLTSQRLMLLKRKLREFKHSFMRPNEQTTQNALKKCDRRKTLIRLRKSEK